MSAAPSSLQPAPVIQIQTRRVTTSQLRDMLARNPKDAARWIETAAKAGMTPAQIVWGQLLLDGHGVARDAGTALTWFEKAAATGDAEARNMVGRCYEQGWGVAADHKRALEDFEIAASAGHVWGQVNVAQMLMRRGNPADRPRCFALFKAAAEGGTRKENLKAMNSLARFLEEGWAGPPDPGGAIFWYLKAAKLGDHWAQYNLATILFRQGEHDSADQWLRDAIVVSDNGFRRRIASILLGRPEPELRARGLDALARCAEKQLPDDLYTYAVALADGVAGASDPVKAMPLFKAAAANGHAAAADRVHAPTQWAAIKHRTPTLIRGFAGRFANFIFQTMFHQKGIS